MKRDVDSIQKLLSDYSIKNKLSRKLKQKITAIHEAGHCVVCFSLGYKFESVTIIPNPINGSDGDFRRSLSEMPLETKNMTDSEFKKWVMDQITITLAGGAAVYNVTDDPKLLGMLPDNEQALGLADMVTKVEEAKSYLITFLAYRAKELAWDKKNWLAINCLADELIIKKTLNYDEAKQIIEKARSMEDGN